jgi:hypothetical protein
MNPGFQFTVARSVAAIAVAALAGCASIKAEDVVVYDAAQLKQGQYETVARLWVETWRARFWTPTYSSGDDGVAALQDKAAGLGANGLINVACYGDSGIMSLLPESFICYGKAIKVSEPDGVIRP